MSESLIIGLAGILTSGVLGGLGLYFGYRARSQPFRERLYDAQLSFILEAIRSANELHSACVALAMAQEETASATARKNAAELGRAFFSTVAQASALAPLPVSDAFTTFAEAVRDYLRVRSPKVDSLSGVDDAWARIVVPIRHFAGVDAISNENLRLFKSLAEELDRASLPTPGS